MHPLWEEIRSVDTSRRAVRSFGWVVGLVLVGIALVIWWRRGWEPGTLQLAFGVAGTALIVLGFVAPAVLRPLYRVWMALAVVLGFVMTRVVLTLVFVTLVLPIGLLLRLFGKDLLHRHPDPDTESYWIRRTPHTDDPARLERYY